MHMQGWHNFALLMRKVFEEMSADTSTRILLETSEKGSAGKKLGFWGCLSQLALCRNEWCLKVWHDYWGTSKQHMKLQQPQNYDFRVYQFNLQRSPKRKRAWNDDSSPGHLHSQRLPNYNNREPTDAKWRLLQNLTTTANCNDSEIGLGVPARARGEKNIPFCNLCCNVSLLLGKPVLDRSLRPTAKDQPWWPFTCSPGWLACSRRAS